MKKIFESDYSSYGDGSSVEKIYVYKIESEDEFWEIENMDHVDICNYFNVQSTAGYVGPGEVFYEYNFYNTTEYVIMIETRAYNV